MSTPPASAPETTQTDVLIVGAGPVGLFAAFQAGVLGLKCELVDVLDRAGGQCTELYPEKPIYDIPAVPGCLAQDLVDRLLEQCAPFAFPMHFSQRAESVSDITGADGHPRLLTTDAGKRFDVAAVLICAGAGAFAPQRVSLPEAPRWKTATSTTRCATCRASPASA
jgi:thioredoxin reductase (NADPH)